ncbi:hypothetical protein ACFSLT_19655 [Novosphingobium resinovorum]
MEFGIIQPIDGAIRAEMSVFSALIQRPEPRNMIRTMFLGKQAYDKAAKDGSLPDSIEAAREAISTKVSQASSQCPELASALFGAPTPDLHRSSGGSVRTSGFAVVRRRWQL